MSQFKFKDYIFHQLIPKFFKDRDTYKDKDSRGILQRFMEVCSGYFDTDIVDNKELPGLDNILNLIDVDESPDFFLNYLWEFFGEIPYAYGVIFNPDNTYSKNTLLNDINIFIGGNRVTSRKLLKYALSLYKIRGTEKFYNILGTFYGVNFTLIETTDGGSSEDEEGDIPNYDHLVLATYLEDTGEYSVATYPLGDEEYRSPYPEGDCYSCLFFTLYIDLSDDMYSYILSCSDLDNIRDIYRSIVEKYLPIHCKISKYSEGSYKDKYKVWFRYNGDKF